MINWDLFFGITLASISILTWIAGVTYGVYIMMGSI